MKKSKRTLISNIGIAFIWIVLLFVFSGVVHGLSGIETCSDLQSMEDELDEDYVLMNDIECSDTINWNSGAGFAPINEFNGTLNGNGYIIKNLFIYRPGASSIGLFGTMSSTSVIIENIGIEDVNITCGYYCGAFAGFMSGLMNKTYSTGYLKDTENNAYLGGLIGVNTGTLMNSYSSASVDSGNGAVVAGLVGDNAGHIENVYFNGNVIGNYIGGSVGALCAMRATGSSMSGFSSFNTDKSILSGFVSDCDSGSYNTWEFWNSTEQMKIQENYIGWDFTDIWQICTRDNEFPSLKFFGLCCIPEFECKEYSACGNYQQTCLEAEDIICNYEFNETFDGSMSQYDKNCSINANTQSVKLENFDLKYSGNQIIFFILIFTWLVCLILSFVLSNHLFYILAFVLGIFIGIICFQIHWILAFAILIFEIYMGIKYLPSFMY